MSEDTTTTTASTTSAQPGTVPAQTPAGAAPLPSAPGPAADPEPAVTDVLGGTVKVAGKVLGTFVVEELLDADSLDLDDFLPAGDDDSTKHANEMAFHKARVAGAEVELDFESGDVVTVKYLSGRTFVRVVEEPVAPAPGVVVAGVGPSAMAAEEPRYAVITVTHGSIHLDFAKQLAGPPPVAGAYAPGSVVRVKTAEAKRYVAARVAKPGALKAVTARVQKGNESVEQVSGWVSLDAE